MRKLTTKDEKLIGKTLYNLGYVGMTQLNEHNIIDIWVCGKRNGKKKKSGKRGC